MKKIKALILTILFVLCTSLTYAASTGTAVWSVDRTTVPGIVIYKAVCTEAATASSPATYNASDYEINGIIIKVETDPGSTAPTANYDIVLNDELGADVMEGELANRSATATQFVRTAVSVAGPLTPVVSNQAVNSATFTIYIHVIEVE